MKLLNKSLRTFEFESILIKKSKSRPKKLLNFKYIPQQLVNDTIEVVKSKSDLVGTYSGFSSINIDIEKLKELGSQDKTLTEIADILGVSINTIKKYLAKYGIVNQQRGELAVIKKCNSATSDREKNEAFSQIDAYLLPIAEKKYKSSKAISFDDFMQDLRLKFLELLAKRQNGNKTIPYNIFSAIRNLKFESSPKILVGKIDLPSYHAAEEDIATINFEETDLLNHIIEDSYLKYTEGEVFHCWFEKKMTFDEIGYYFRCSHQTARDALKNAIEKIKKCRDIVTHDEHIKKRAKEGYEIVEENRNKTLGIKVVKNVPKTSYKYVEAEEKELDAMAETVQDAIASKDINKLKEILKIKVTNGDFLNRPVKNTFHYNAIHYALATRWEAGIKLLLSRSDLDLKVLDGYKRSPLSRAESWNEKIAKMFIEHPSLLQKK